MLLSFDSMSPCMRCAEIGCKIERDGIQIETFVTVSARVVRQNGAVSFDDIKFSASDCNGSRLELTDAEEVALTDSAVSALFEVV